MLKNIVNKLRRLAEIEELEDDGIERELDPDVKLWGIDPTEDTLVPYEGPGYRGPGYKWEKRRRVPYMQTDMRPPRGTPKAQ